MVELNETVNTVAVLGASGQTGRQVVGHALSVGLNLRVLIRNPKSQIFYNGLQTVIGDATDAGAISELLQGADVVISALGPTDHSTGFTVCSEAASHLVDLMPKAGISRYVAVSGASLSVPTDKFSLRGKFFSTAASVLTMTSRQLKLLLLDKEKEYLTLKGSGLKWTLVRPPYIVPGRYLREANVTPFRLHGSKVRVGELAMALLDLAQSDLYSGQAVFINSQGG